MLSETWMKQFNHEEHLKMLFAHRGVICHPKSTNPSKRQISAVYSAPSSPYGYCRGVETQKQHRHKIISVYCTIMRFLLILLLEMTVNTYSTERQKKMFLAPHPTISLTEIGG